MSESVLRVFSEDKDKQCCVCYLTKLSNSGFEENKGFSART